MRVMQVARFFNMCTKIEFIALFLMCFAINLPQRYEIVTQPICVTTEKLKKQKVQTNLFIFLYLCTKYMMNSRIDILKGIHPGIIIGRDLKKRNLSQRLFASQIEEHNQTLNAVIKGHRNLTTEMAVKIENALGYDEGFLLVLQSYYEINEYKLRLSAQMTQKPQIRKSLFWDSDFEKIDWIRQKRAVINRVLERGNQAEKEEIARFYNIPIEMLSHYKINNDYQINRLL